jgi:hypothetical protein
VSEEKIYALSDLATAAQLRIQKDYKHLDPVVGVSRNLRKSGFPADVMTIDCIKSGRRILFLLHDDTPEQVSYEHGYRDKDPAFEFSFLVFDEITDTTFYDLITDYMT